MNDKTSDLTLLRDKIDKVDEEILDLLNLRFDLVKEVGKAKEPNKTIIRPGREAQILRKCISNNLGKIKPEVIHSIWRELVTASCLIQGPLNIIVCAPTKSVGYWSLARDHFGSLVSMKINKSAKQTIQLVNKSTDSMGLLPLPEEYDSQNWWPLLISPNNSLPMIVGKLPFLRSSDNKLEKLNGILIANFFPEKSGNDKTWIVLEMNKKISFALMQQILKDYSADSFLKAIYSEANDSNYYLVEVNRFIEDQSDIFESLKKTLSGIRRVIILGSYAI